jgi:hypothetical protein
MSRTIDLVDATHLRFLSRWALIPPLAVIGSQIVFQNMLGGQSVFPTQPDIHPDVYFNLVLAGQSPGLYRLATLLFVVLFVGLGGTLLTFAIVFAARSPLASGFLAACAVGQLGGILGPFVRVGATADLAARYATASAAQQPALLEVFRAFNEADTVMTYVAFGLFGIGCLLVAALTQAVAGFPRWLTVWFAVAGIAGLAIVAALFVTGSIVPFPVLGIQILIGVLGLHLAIALAFWRAVPSTTPNLTAARAR